jgi:sugar phosphate isomerase/epimerase
VKFAFSRSAKGGTERKELFETFGPAGFDGLQLKSNQYADYLDEPERFLADWGQYPGVASGLIHGGLLDDDGVATLRKVIQFGGAVGTDLVIYWPKEPREDASVDFAEFARRMSELGQEARESGVKLSLHHHHNQIVMTHDEMETFFGAISPGSVGLTVDTAHLVKSGMTDVAAVVRDFSEVIDNYHLKDFGEGEWRVLGRGDIDFAPIFAAIRETGFDGWVCADEESGADFAGALAACYSMLAEGLPESVTVRS